MMKQQNKAGGKLRCVTVILVILMPFNSFAIKLPIPTIKAPPQKLDQQVKVQRKNKEKALILARMLIKTRQCVTWPEC